jgi:ribosomal protein S18 acetylase RimI-like enzyme
MPWTSCRIRYATLNDARAISTIYEQSTQTAYQDVMAEAPIYSRLLGRLEPFWAQKLAIPPSKEQRILVAEYEDQVVGFVEIGVPTYPEEVATEDTGELHFLFVAPDLMGGGIGSRLLARATELLHEDGYRQAILWVFSRNLQARRFYESHG